MGNRGHKREETVDELPADKRACNSFEFRPGSSNSSVQMNSESTTPEAQDSYMDTSSSTSGSNRSEGEAEKDSAYGSCDSDELGDADHRLSTLRDYQRRRLSSDQGKLKRVVTTLGEETDQSGLLAALTELCELLSFCGDSSLSSLMADSLSPVLVRLARHESNPDIMLLAIRALTYLCDVHPRSSGFLVRHDVVHALCQKLMAIEYLDVAEQCLQALEKISREQPLACLQSGAVMAVLSYIDFFSTSLQRVALSTVVNICKKLPSESLSPILEAVPILCNLLQYEDRQLVESVTTCLIKITDRVCHSSDLLDDLCRHGLVDQTTRLLDLNSRTTLSRLTHTGLIGLLVKFASGSILAFKMLHELNISRILKDILSSYGLLHGMPSPNMTDGRCNQVHEVLKLLHELVPAVAGDQEAQLSLDKNVFLENRLDLLQKFGMDLLPVVIQVVDSGANLYLCYGCLSVINKIVNISKSDALLDLLKNTSISSFLAGVFTRKDHHVLLLALQITDTILQKLPDIFLSSFAKEGVLFSIDALLVPEKCPRPVLSSFQMSNDLGHRSSSRDFQRCVCYAFDSLQSSLSSETGSCKLTKDSVHNLAKHIRTSYFTSELLNLEKGLTDVLQKLKVLSAALTDLVSLSMVDENCSQHEEDFYCILSQIVELLNGRESVSTFEFIESGILESLVNYLSNGQFLRNRVEPIGVSSHLNVVEKRFELFGRLFLSSSGPLMEAFPLAVLIQKLQSALSSIENFPVVLSHASRQRSSYATVPFGRITAYSCLKVQFVREEGETCLLDCSKDVLTVDPFASLDDVEGYLWPKVSGTINEDIKSSSHSVNKMETAPSQFLLEADSPHEKSTELMEPYSTPSTLPVTQDDKLNLSKSSPEDAACLGQAEDETTGSSRTHNDPAEHDEDASSDDANLGRQCPAYCNKEDDSKLVFYLEGQLLDRSMSLYQALIQRQIKLEQEIVCSSKLWSQVYKVTYGRSSKSNLRYLRRCHHGTHNSSVLDKSAMYWQYTPFFSGVFISDLASALEKSTPAYDILVLLRCLESMNRFRFHLMSRERLYAFAEGTIDNLDSLKVIVSAVRQNELVNSKLTEKLEQQLRDPLAVSLGGMPCWCVQLMASCPFVFSFEVRCKYLRLAAFGQLQAEQHQSPHSNSGGPNGRRQNTGSLTRKKFLVCRERILESAAQMMDLHGHQKTVLEVEYNDEVGTGLGPTLEFYTLVSREFQKSGMGMWREDNMLDSGSVIISPFGLFPRPWSSTMNISNNNEFSEVINKYVLLGKIVAKSLQDGRVLDLPFSKAFYKLILGQELTIYDIHSFDPRLGRALLEFQALVEKEKHLKSFCGGKSTLDSDSCFHNTRIEDLCLDFTVPGYPDYTFTSGSDAKMVNMANLEEYVSFVVDAMISAGIFRQIEAFKSGFNQVFPIKHLQIFTEEELEHLLCGELELWNSNELLDHVKFDHGYTASSLPIINFMEIIQEFDHEERRAFLQFVTGAPQLPPGGLASLNPKLTIVSKQSSRQVDADLPSVMTCANYLKLPPYSSKEIMKDKLLYAITEGQGSFHLS